MTKMGGGGYVKRQGMERKAEEGREDARMRKKRGSGYWRCRCSSPVVSVHFGAPCG